jgi:hypothetical protein
MESAGLARVKPGARNAGLAISEQLDVIPIAGGKGRLFSVFTLKRVEFVPAMATVSSTELVLRDASGARTNAALELRRFFGLEGPASEPPSPRRAQLAQRRAI